MDAPRFLWNMTTKQSRGYHGAVVEEGEKMADIKLENGQNGYDVVGEYIKRYWKHNYIDTVIVSLGLSRDGKTYDSYKGVATPYYSDIEFLDDWWEGEKFIRIFGIKTLNELDIYGGIYSEGMAG